MNDGRRRQDLLVVAGSSPSHHPPLMRSIARASNNTLRVTLDGGRRGAVGKQQW